jgi:uncharacterized protein YuzE
MEEKYINALLRMVPRFVRDQNMWVKYDFGADVLYIDVMDTDRVNNAVLTEENIIIRYRNDEVAGITVLQASTRNMPPEFDRKMDRPENRKRGIGRNGRNGSNGQW